MLTCMVSNGRLADPETGRDRKRGNETLHELHGKKRLANLAAHDPQLAAGIVYAILENRAPHDIRDPRHDAAKRGIVSVDAPAAGEINLARLDEREEGRIVAGIILAVAVHHEQILAPRGSQPGEERDGLAGVLRHAQLDTLGPAGVRLGELGGGVVGAAVVDQDDFERAADRAQHVDGTRDEGQDIAGFVEDGHDQGKLRRRDGHGSGVKRMQMKPGRRPRKDSRYVPRNFARTASAWVLETITSAPSQSSGGVE